jgi:hypothetical protein
MVRTMIDQPQLPTTAWIQLNSQKIGLAMTVSQP